MFKAFSRQGYLKLVNHEMIILFGQLVDTHTHQCNVTMNYIFHAPELGREWLSRPACGPWPRTACRTSWESRAESCCAPPHSSWRGPGCGSPSVSCLVTEFLTPSRISVSSCSEFHFCMLNFAPFGAHFGWMILANVTDLSPLMNSEPHCKRLKRGDN